MRHPFPFAIIALLALLLVSPPAIVTLRAAQAFVNSAQESGGTLAISVTAGQTLVGCSRIGLAADTQTSWTDGLSNTYTLVMRQDYGHGAAVMFYSNITNSGTTSLVGAPNMWQMQAQLFSGLNTSSPLDQFTGNNNTTQAWSSGTTGTTTQANETVVTCFATRDLDSGTPTPDSGGGYTAAPTFTNYRDFMQYKFVTATGTQSGGGSGSVGSAYEWAGVIATFKEAGGGAAPPKRMLLMGVGERMR